MQQSILCYTTTHQQVVLVCAEEGVWLKQSPPIHLGARDQLLAQRSRQRELLLHDGQRAENGSSRNRSSSSREQTKCLSTYCKHALYNTNPFYIMASVLQGAVAAAKADNRVFGSVHW
jgi:hypothetical protein